jgi:hypothetical protein
MESILAEGAVMNPAVCIEILSAARAANLMREKRRLTR